MTFFDNFQRGTFFLFAGIFTSGLCSLVAVESMHVDKCVKIIPGRVCKLSAYELRIHDITEPGSPIIGVAEGSCVYVIGEGKFKRYAMAEAMFTAANRTDYMSHGIEVPASQSVVCEIK